MAVSPRSARPHTGSWPRPATRLAGDDTNERWIKVADGPDDVKDLTRPDCEDPDETSDEQD